MLALLLFLPTQNLNGFRPFRGSHVVDCFFFHRALPCVLLLALRWSLIVNRSCNTANSIIGLA